MEKREEMARWLCRGFLIAPKNSSQARRPSKILIVDDDHRIASFLRVKLKISGYQQIIYAANGIEALEKVISEDPDIITLDLMMPQMDGYEMLKELRKFSATPVIILSAGDEFEAKIKSLESGADDYLAKPFNPDELVARIDALWRRAKLRYNDGPCDYDSLSKEEKESWMEKADQAIAIAS